MGRPFSVSLTERPESSSPSSTAPPPSPPSDSEGDSDSSSERSIPNATGIDAEELSCATIILARYGLESAYADAVVYAGHERIVRGFGNNQPVLATSMMPKMTQAFDFPNIKYIIHTVAPLYVDGTTEEADHLAQCYGNALELAEEERLSTVVFTPISTISFPYPANVGARVAMRTILSMKFTYVKRVTFVGLQGDMYLAFQRAAQEFLRPADP